MPDLTDAKRRLVDHLQRVDSATAGELATTFGLTDAAVRQHLDALQHAGLVSRTEGTPSGRGRPAARWELTGSGRSTFTDRHDDLTVELLDAIRAELGEPALTRVIEARTRRLVASYRESTGGDQTPVTVRIARLAARRTEEGYAAEVILDGRDAVLVEHHCPICTAAMSCPALCDSELDVFQSVLGSDVTVTREQHLLRGDRRCAYRISAA